MTAPLITSLEQAGEGSRALDCQIAVLLDGYIAEPSRYGWDAPDYAYIDAEGARVSPGHGGDQLVPHYSTSLDAALALASRVLPYTTFRIDLDQRPRVWAFDKEDCFGTPSTIGSRVRDWEAYADAQTPALALCIAILRATNPKGQPNV